MWGVMQHILQKTKRSQLYVALFEDFSVSENNEIILNDVMLIDSDPLFIVPV